MLTNLEDFLLKEIVKSGYPLEIEISSILDKDWFVSNNEYYVDFVENKTREIDIHASSKSFDKQYPFEEIKPFSLRYELAIECKKSEADAWVFFTRPQKVTGSLDFDGQCIDFLGFYSKDYHLCFIDSVLDLLGSSLHYSNFDRIARTYSIIRYSGKGKGSKTKDEIFEASNQLVKFLAYNFDSFIKIIKKRHEDGFISPKSSRVLYICFPIIVFDGKLYEVMVNNGSPKLFEREHILLSKDFIPNYWTGTREQIEGVYLSYLIDIVTKNAFPDFLNTIHNNYRLLWTTIKNNLDSLKEEAKEDISTLV